MTHTAFILTLIVLSTILIIIAFYVYKIINRVQFIIQGNELFVYQKDSSHKKYICNIYDIDCIHLEITTNGKTTIYELYILGKDEILDSFDNSSFHISTAKSLYKKIKEKNPAVKFNKHRSGILNFFKFYRKKNILKEFDRTGKRLSRPINHKFSPWDIL